MLTALGAVLAAATVNGSVPAIELPRPEGPHAVGYWSTVFRSDRPDDLSPGAKRELLLEVFYPARPGENLVKPYATPFVAGWLSKEHPLPEGFAKDVRTHARREARVADGKLPVLVFSHGLSWPASLYQSLTEDLASRGYVVVAANHPHGAAIDYGNGKALGREAWPNVEGEAAQEATLARRAGDWAADLREVVTEVASWTVVVSNNPVSGHLDPSRMGAFGHSLGGSAVGRLTVDPRIVAVAVMEGKTRTEDGAAVKVEKPLLHLIGGYNRLELEGDGYLPGKDAPVFQAVIQGTGHAYFSDLIYLYRTYADDAWRKRHRYEVEPARVLQITRDYLAAFFDRYLKGQDPGVLLRPVSYQHRVDRPSLSGYPEVDLSIAVP